MFIPRPLAFVDLETTGMGVGTDRIIEVGVVEVDQDGSREWSTLVRPGAQVPAFIASMTGITDAMLEDAPSFAEIADDLFARLEGRLFIAHNARFDHGFLKSEFRRVGLDFKPTVLCTVKLSRRLFPGFGHHNLDALIERHRLDVAQRHRALGDAQLIWQFWQVVDASAEPETLARVVNELTARPSLPSHLDAGLIDALPTGPGVYLFFGENRLPLYIGKALDLRRRVLSHFSGDHRSARGLEMSQQIRRIEWRETAGEIGALLEEARLVKQLMPAHNRLLRRSTQLCAWRLMEGHKGFRIELAQGDDLFFDQDNHLYGLYSSTAQARLALRHLAEQHQLCTVLLGLDRGRPGKPCFASQVGCCRGACAGRESVAEHQRRLHTHLEPWRLQAWPFAGPIGIREGCALHVIDRWAYLGTACSDEDVHSLLEIRQSAFDRDVYRIVAPRLPRLARQIVPFAAQP
jgi:DNA polymerase-3 subunit epsilon